MSNLIFKNNKNFSKIKSYSTAPYPYNTNTIDLKNTSKIYTLEKL